MDADRFDALTRSLTEVAPSRRRLLAGGAGSALATLATTLGFAQTGATDFGCLHVGERCKDASQCCSSRCKRRRCRAHNVGRCTFAKDVCDTLAVGCGGGSCFCLPTTGAAYFCAARAEGDLCMPCTTDAECADALDTPGAACIDHIHGFCRGCAGSDTVCAKPCTA